MTSRKIKWEEADLQIAALPTDKPNDIHVRREAIPIIFVPGIMGSRLRRAGTDGTGETEGLSNLRWDTNATMLWKYAFQSASFRKTMLVGETFSSGYLEVDNDKPCGNGFKGLITKYEATLKFLSNLDWGVLNKLFVFPIYAFGYNWTDSNVLAGEKLNRRIDDIIEECRKRVGADRCNKVILMTHSMGGIVAREACRTGAEGKVLGVLHGVQPFHGSAAAYWRMKGGFEKLAVGQILGADGREVTAVLANSPGGLQLLPNKQYRSNRGPDASAWLFVEDGKGSRALPQHGNPYKEIYQLPANPGPNAAGEPDTFWGLVDPALLSPSRSTAPPANAEDAMIEQMNPASTPWEEYLDYLGQAEQFHDQLAGYLRHPQTWRFHGTGLKSPDEVRLTLDAAWRKRDSYPDSGFRGYLRTHEGKLMKSVLQDPTGDGDGTVPTSSATCNHGPESPSPPVNIGFPGVEHQPAYDDGDVRKYVVSAVHAMVKKHFMDQHG
jgi:pimeloyl-ACP methyl ester carboxylesterase